MTAVRPATTTLPDGRLLAWTEFGPATAAPVLFAPGAGTSSALGFAVDRLPSLAVRLIAIDRPGLGRSTPAPGRRLADFAADVAALTAARRLGRPAMVGYSQGAPFALACAAAAVVADVAVVAGTDELAAPTVRSRLPEPVRALVEAVVDDPAAAEARFATMTAAQLHALIAATSDPRDLAVYQAPPLAAALRAALDEGFAQGSAGYARDAVLTMGPWGLDLAAIRTPVHLWYGAHDASPVHSPDHGATLATRIPGARRTVVADGGGALPWTHGETILAELVGRGA